MNSLSNNAPIDNGTISANMLANFLRSDIKIRVKCSYEACRNTIIHLRIWAVYDVFVRVRGECNTRGSGFCYTYRIILPCRFLEMTVAVSCVSYKQHAFHHLCLVVTIHGIPGLIRSHSLLHSTGLWISCLCSSCSLYLCLTYTLYSGCEKRHFEEITCKWK